MIEIKCKKDSHGATSAFVIKKISELPPPTHLSALSALSEGFATTHPPHRETSLRNDPKGNMDLLRAFFSIYRVKIKMRTCIQPLLVLIYETFL
jgi:hypothetical protein